MKILAYQLNAAFCSLVFLFIAYVERGTFWGGAGIVGFVFMAILELMHCIQFERYFHNV